MSEQASDSKMTSGKAVSLEENGSQNANNPIRADQSTEIKPWTEVRFRYDPSDPCEESWEPGLTLIYIPYLEYATKGFDLSKYFPKDQYPNYRPYFGSAETAMVAEDDYEATDMSEGWFEATSQTRQEHPGYLFPLTGKALERDQNLRAICAEVLCNNRGMNTKNSKSHRKVRAWMAGLDAS